MADDLPNLVHGAIVGVLEDETDLTERYVNRAADAGMDAALAVVNAVEEE